MNIEIQVAENFILNFLFNKLPRRRVNLFGQELKQALLEKFQDHWYPDKPFKGSAYRCLRITDINDPVLKRSARESGNPVSDIIENLPQDLTIWIDPGEVSYRIGEKGSVKILHSENQACKKAHEASGFNGREWSFVKAFPEEKNITSGCLLENLSISNKKTDSIVKVCKTKEDIMTEAISTHPCSSGKVTNQFQQPVIYTAGTFAQTKFGSTKLKTNSKKTNRMSPTEFANYIKSRALQKQSPSNNRNFMNNSERNFREPFATNPSVKQQYFVQQEVFEKPFGHLHNPQQIFDRDDVSSYPEEFALSNVDFPSLYSPCINKQQHFSNPGQVFQNSNSNVHREEIKREYKFEDPVFRKNDML